MAERKNISALILAGGKSSRMGTCKAELPWHGTTLVDFQASKLRSLGIDDIVISGYAKAISGTRRVPDAYESKGPLGGIHAGLLAAKHEHCLVISVDAPFIPESVLTALINEHRDKSNAVTVLGHGGEIEPLIGMYEKRLSSVCEEILKTERTSVRELYKLVPLSVLDYDGNAALLFDCDTPEDYQKALQQDKSK